MGDRGGPGAASRRGLQGGRGVEQALAVGAWLREGFIHRRRAIGPACGWLAKGPLPLASRRAGGAASRSPLPHMAGRASLPLQAVHVLLAGRR